MENQVQTANTSLQVRDLVVITNEIKHYWYLGQQSALTCILEVGRRLHEAKSMIKHGEWGSWLKANFEFSQNQAINFMRLYDEYGSDQLSLFGTNSNSQSIVNLPYSKALQLLAIPSEDREAFAKEVDAENLSQRELKKAIEDRKAAEQAAAEAAEREQELSQKLASAEIAKAAAEKKAAEVDKAREQVAKLEADLEKRKKSEAKLKDKLKAAETNPKIPDETLAKLKADAEAEIKAAQGSEIERQIKEAKEDAVADIERLQKELDEARTALDAAEQAKAQAEVNAKETLDKLSEAQKKLKLANPKVTLFKTLFEDLQGTYSKLCTVLADISEESPEIANSLSGAIRSFADMIRKE